MIQSTVKVHKIVLCFACPHLLHLKHSLDLDRVLDILIQESRSF